MENLLPKAENNRKVLEDLLGLQEQDRHEFMCITKKSDIEWTPPLTKLVERVITHYENHYRVESNLIKESVKVLLLLSPEWPSHLEDAFLWVGGWRPSMAFHLLDFKPGLQLGAIVGELLQGVSMDEFTDILSSQLVRFGELQRQTIREETELTQSLADSGSPVEIDTEPDSPDSVTDSCMVTNGHHGLREIFCKADDLRLRTLKSLVQILSPIQAVQLFIPLAQLHLKIQKWGKTKKRAKRAGRSTLDDFGGFFDKWLREQEQDLQELRSTSKACTESTHPRNELTQNACVLVEQVLDHYKSYYRVKSESVKKDVLHMLAPAWRSVLEQAFLWIGGWRPSVAFHLLYTVVGLQLEAGLAELMAGLKTGDLGDLSSSQIIRVSELHMETVAEERELTETLASLQETVADSSMVQLSRLATEITREPESMTQDRVTTESIHKLVELTLGTKEDKLKEIFGKADGLRMKTLRNVVDILSPIQAVHFLIGAAELHLRVHECGKNKDAVSG